MLNKFSLGVNYWPRKTGVRIWKDFNAADIDADFKALASVGVDTVRMFLLWEDFQNIREFRTGAWDQDIPFDVRLADWSHTLLERSRNTRHPELVSGSPLPVDLRKVELFDQVIDIAKQNGLRLIPTLFTMWMSGIDFDPDFRQGRNIFADPTMLRYQTYYARFFAQRYCDEEQIVAWDLANEQNCAMTCPSRDAGWLWTHTITSELKRWDKNHPVTSGMHCLDNTPGGKSGFAITDVAECCDFTCVHPYPYFFPRECPDRFDNIRTSYLAAFQNRLYEGIGGKPVMAEEFGTLGMSAVGEEIAAEYVRTILHRLYEVGSLGALWWCGFDFDCRCDPPYEYCPMEGSLGLFNKDGSPNLVGQEFRKFAAFLDEKGGKRVLPSVPSTAIVLPKREENQPVLFNSYILGSMAGLDCGIYPIMEALKDRHLLIFPCLGHQGLWASEIDLVREWVAKGGVACFTYNGMQFPEQNQFFGIKTLTRQKDPAGSVKGKFIAGPDGIKGSEFKYQRSGSWRLVIEPTTSEVIAVDNAGNPLILQNDYGDGKAILITEPLELYLSAMPDALPECNMQVVYEYLRSLMV